MSKQDKNLSNRTVPGPPICAIAVINENQEYSPELRQAWKSFKENLPSSAELREISSPSLLEDETLELLERHAPEYDYVLFVLDSAIVCNPNCIQNLCSRLEGNPDLDIAIASDARDHDAHYFTLLGFERFCNAFVGKDNGTIDYDGRFPLLALVRMALLENTPRATADVVSLLQSSDSRSSVDLNCYIHTLDSYFAHTREEFIELVPRSINSLLDIGCGEGQFGRLVKSALSNCRATGIEINRVAAEKAKSNLDEVVVGDPHSIDFGTRFQCVSCLDTIEHFADPDSLVDRIKNVFLEPDGYLILSVPNVGHWSIIETLLAGRWDYTPEGILCNSHLRFFTLSSITALIASHDFRILKTMKVEVPAPEAFSRALTEMNSPGIEIDPSSLNAYCFGILAQLSNG